MQPSFLIYLSESLFADFAQSFASEGHGVLLTLTH